MVEVVGSSPIASTKKKGPIFRVFFFLRDRNENLRNKKGFRKDFVESFSEKGGTAQKRRRSAFAERLCLKPVPTPSPIASTKKKKTDFSGLFFLRDRNENLRNKKGFRKDFVESFSEKGGTAQKIRRRRSSSLQNLCKQIFCANHVCAKVKLPHHFFFSLL